MLAYRIVAGAIFGGALALLLIWSMSVWVECRTDHSASYCARIMV